MTASFSVEELEKAIESLDEGLQFAENSKNNLPQYKIARDACIQRFEYCIELSWKVSMKKTGSRTKFPKQAIREMARGDLIKSSEVWLDFIEARNNTSHSYDENIAKKVFEQIVSFASEVRHLIKELRALP